MTDDQFSDIPVDFWCSELAQAAAEPAVGTAVLAETWLLLEVPGRWMPKAFEDGDLHSDVKAHLQAALDRLPQGRIQFIKQTDSRERGTRFLFIARSAGADSVLYRVEFGELEDLLALPFTSEWLDELEPVDEPLYLVCTHGTRDRCCARSGTEVFTALSEYRPGQVWQSSHLGGHRFAANLACLPDGVLYGYVAPESVADLIDTHEAGQVDPSLLRGRSNFSKPVQAAEGFLWREMADGFSGPVRLYTHEEESAQHRVVFALDDDSQVTITLEERAPVYANYVSCGAARPKPVTHYRLVGLTAS